MSLKRFLFALFLILTVPGGVSPGDPDYKRPLRTPQTLNNIRIVDPKSHIGGSACPVGVGAIAFTAKHVTDGIPDEPPPDPPIKISIWADPLEEPMIAHPARVVSREADRDLAIVQPVEGLFPHPAPIAKRAPIIGEEVIIDGLIDDGRATQFYGRVVQTDQTGELIIFAPVWWGSSGGCIKSLKTGEVYAIVSHTTPHIEMPKFLMGVPIWGR